MSAEQATLFLGTLQERLTVVASDALENFADLDRFAAHGIVGGTIYSAMIALCALKADAEAIYTWNLCHFRQCEPAWDTLTRHGGWWASSPAGCALKVTTPPIAAGDAR